MHAGTRFFIVKIEQSNWVRKGNLISHRPVRRLLFESSRIADFKNGENGKNDLDISVHIEV